MMRLARWQAMAGSLLLAALLSLPALSADRDSRRTAAPGTLNYVEGQASIGDATLDTKAVGNTDLQNGEILETGNGKAEILLTPGVYLRLGSNSSVKMVSNSLTYTQLSVNQGEAMLEVDRIYPENNIQISQPGADTRVVKTGLYDFDATAQQIRVFDGKAVVSADDRNTTLKKGHELALNDAKVKARDFDKKEVTQNSDLYRWSSLRSEYLAEANVDAARTYFVNGGYGPGWWGPGWYWDPFFAGYTFLPGSGFFYNPFGWGFYSPLVVWRAPVVVAGGFHRFNGNRPVAIGRGFNNHAVTSFRSSSMGAGHAGGGMHGGGFGGFHGDGRHR
jgi:FecR protein